MDLPVEFPSETEVILEDVERFRTLSPAERIREIRGLLADGEFLMSRSSRTVSVEEDSREQKRRERQSIREFVDRHGR